MLRTGLMIRMGMVSSEKVGSRWFLWYLYYFKDIKEAEVESPKYLHLVHLAGPVNQTEPGK